MIRIFLSGASGNVGRTIVRTIRERDGFELVGGWCLEAGADLGTLAGVEPLGIIASGSLEEGLGSSRPDLVIDFSSARTLENSLNVYLNAGLDAVIGTTGLTEEQIRPFGEQVAAKRLRWAAIPNFGLGIGLISNFLRAAREYFPYVSIIDQHHEHMANAPSGTAAALAALAGDTPGGTASKEIYPCVLGSSIGGARVHSQRLPWPGPFSGHEITLGRKDEIIRISIMDFSSDIYMDGLFLAAGKIKSLPPGSFVRDLAEFMAN